jgi:hypothetical protein
MIKYIYLNKKHDDNRSFRPERSEHCHSGEVTSLASPRILGMDEAAVVAGGPDVKNEPKVN